VHYNYSPMVVSIGFDSDQYDWKDRIFLITEDEEVNFFYLKALLKSTSATIIRAKNGKEALDIINSSEKIDLVLMDINMPVMDGLEATKLIKLTHPEIPIIAQTAYTMSEDRNKCLQAGFNEYIAKPVRKNTLFPIMSGFLE